MLFVIATCNWCHFVAKTCSFTGHAMKWLILNDNMLKFGKRGEKWSIFGDFFPILMFFYFGIFFEAPEWRTETCGVSFCSQDPNLSVAYNGFTYFERWVGLIWPKPQKYGIFVQIMHYIAAALTDEALTVSLGQKATENRGGGSRAESLAQARKKRKKKLAFRVRAPDWRQKEKK